MQVLADGEHTVPFQSIRQSHVTGSSVLSKISPCHRSPRPLFSRSNVWQGPIKGFWCQTQCFEYFLVCLDILVFAETHFSIWHPQTICFWLLECLKFWYCHRSLSLVSKCLTDPMSHSHRVVSNWLKWYSIPHLWPPTTLARLGTIGTSISKLTSLTTCYNTCLDLFRPFYGLVTFLMSRNLVLNKPAFYFIK